MQFLRLIALVAIVIGTPSFAAEMATPINSKDLQWGPAPPMLPKGAQMAVLSGDPQTDGPYVVRVKLPAGYKVPAHRHPTTEYVTVLSGNFNIGMGDKLDTTKGISLTTGGFGEAPAGMNHFAWADTAAEIQIHGQGPFSIIYVNLADDPSKQ